MRGALRNVTNARWDAVDAALAKTNAKMLADGEVVWSWRPGAGAKFVRSKLLRDDGGNKPVTGESSK